MMINHKLQLGIAVIPAALCLMLMPLSAASRDTIHIVGSSTVFPFATLVAERFGRSPRYRTPTVESTGSGGGMKLFCAGVGPATPDISNSSRRIKASEVDLCAKNQVGDIIELKIGYDGIVIASSRKVQPLKLTRRDIYLALAKEIPHPTKAGIFIRNPHKTWKSVNPSLPNKPISVLGPPPTSGTRDAFVELAMEGGCKKFSQLAALKKKDKQEFKRRCHTIREDGRWIEAGENDNLIIQKLVVDPQAVGIFGYSFLQENRDKIAAATVEGYEPTFENISAGNYPVSRSLFFYLKKRHIGQIPGLKAYLRRFVSSSAIGPDGYLTERGLIPLAKEELARYRNAARNLTPLEL